MKQVKITLLKKGDIFYLNDLQYNVSRRYLNEQYALIAYHSGREFRFNDKELQVSVPESAPVPKKHGLTVYPFADLELGESFTINKPANNVRTSARAFKAKHKDYDFSFVAMTDGSTQVTRIQPASANPQNQ